MNKFTTDTKPHDSITVDYYMSTLLISIAQFVKRVAKPTLLENCEEAIAVEKDLQMIGVIKDDEPTKDYKDVSRKSQVMASKGRDKEETNIEILTRLVKKLTPEVFELKQQKTDTFARSSLPRKSQGSNSSGSK